MLFTYQNYNIFIGLHILAFLPNFGKTLAKFAESTKWSFLQRVVSAKCLSAKCHGSGVKHASMLAFDKAYLIRIWSIYNTNTAFDTGKVCARG